MRSVASILLKILLFLLTLIESDRRVAASNAMYTRLINHLFTDYVKEIRPAIYPNFPTMTRLSMSLTAIDDLEERNQIFVSSVVIRINYLDDYLSWNPTAFGNITGLIYTQEHLWLPDLIVENSVEKLGQLGYREMTLNIVNTGKVYWKPSAVLRTTCNVDVTYYPFDTQTCTIILSTWTSSAKDINLLIDTAKSVDVSSYQQSGAWELVSTSIEDVSGHFSQNRIGFNFTIKRRKTYYVLNLIIPVIALCATASLVFGLPADAGEKIGMSITVLLAYAVYLTIISESMPRTSLQVSIMGVYLSILLAATAMAVVLTVLVLNLYHRDDAFPPGKGWRYFTLTLRPCIRMYDLSKGFHGDWDGSRIQKYCNQSSTSVKDITLSQKEEKSTRNSAMSILFRRSKVGHGNDHNGVLTESKANRQVVNSNITMETRDAPIVLWKHVSETMDRFLFILFTSFTAVSSLVFVGLMSFGSP